MTIRIAGETYDDADALNAKIVELEETRDGMGDGPERASLAAHIDTLRAAADGNGSGEDAASPAAEPEPEPEPSPEDEELRELIEQTHSLRDAADNGKEIVCPLCGTEVPFPDTPPLDAYATKCEDCDGWGQVLTGSRVDGHVWRNCKGCDGQGFRERTEHSVAVPPRKAAPTPEAPGAMWNAESEQWDRPEGAQPPWNGATWDSFYGKWA